MSKKQRAESLLEKLAKKAESAKSIGNAEEAALFASKVAELADKYGLEIPDVTRVENDFITFPFKAARYYEKSYISSLAELYGVAGIYSTYKKSKRFKSEAYIILHGTEQAIEMVKIMYEASKLAIDTAAKIAVLEHRKKRKSCFDLIMTSAIDEKDANKMVNEYHVPEYRFKIDFYTGVGYGIKERVNEARDSYQKGLREIISVEYKRALDHYIENNETTSVSNNLHDPNAFNAGRDAAKNAKSGKMLGGNLFLNESNDTQWL